MRKLSFSRQSGTAPKTYQIFRGSLVVGNPVKAICGTLLAMMCLLVAHSADAQVMVVQTVAGTGTAGFSGDGGAATNATFRQPSDIAVDPAGNIYVADQRNHRIRKVDAATGIVTTIAGTGIGTYGGDGGPATAAHLWYPHEVKLDAAGNIYIADVFNERIRKIDAGTGIITTIAGGGTLPYSSGMVGTSLAHLKAGGLGVDAVGNCYFMDKWAGDTMPRISRLDASAGIITAFVDSSGRQGFSGDGGLAINALVNNNNYYPGITMGIDSAGNVIFPDIANNRIRAVSPSTGIINTIAGTGVMGMSGDGGPALAATVYQPSRIAIDRAGSVYFFNSTYIRKVDRTADVVSTIAGGGSSSADGVTGSAARITNPYALATDSLGNVYYIDDEVVRKLVPGCGSVVAGTLSRTGGSAYCDSALVSYTLPGATMGVDVSYQWKSSTDGVTWTNVGSNMPNYITGRLYTTTYFKAIVTCNTASVHDSTAIDTITVSTMSAGSIVGVPTVCERGATTLSNATVGGTWTSSHTAIASVSPTGVVIGMAGGGATISYTVTNVCGTTVAMMAVTVQPLPVVGTIAGATTVCQGVATTLSNAVSGGTWNSSVTGVATISSVGVVTGVAPGVTRIGYFLINSCGAALDTILLTVNPAPEAGTIAGADTVCPGEGMVLTGVAPGGSWSSSEAAIATVSVTGGVGGVMPGMATIRYLYTNTCGSDTAVFVVRVLSHAMCLAAVHGQVAAGGPRLYPNPTTGSFVVDMQSGVVEEVTVVVRNVLGEQVKKLVTNSGAALTIDMQVAPGVYLVCISTEQATYQAKLVVQ